MQRSKMKYVYIARHLNNTSLVYLFVMTVYKLEVHNMNQNNWENGNYRRASIFSQYLDIYVG